MRRLADSSRRGEEKKEEGTRERRKKDRNAEAGSALILKSTLVGLSPSPFLPSLSSPFCLSLFFNPAERALQRDENPTGHRQSCHGDEKRIFFVLSSLFFHPLSSLSFSLFLWDESSPLFPPFRPFRGRWNHRENDSTRFRGAFVRRAFNTHIRPISPSTESV